MNKDMKQGLAIGMAFATAVAFIPHKANAEITNDNLCPSAIDYAIKYIPEEDGYKLHQARWKILSGDNTDDFQKMVGLTMFEMGQFMSYRFDEEMNPGNKIWWNEAMSQWRASCQTMLDDWSGNSAPEGMGTDEIW